MALAPIAAITSLVAVAESALAPPAASVAATASRGVVGAMIGVATTTPACAGTADDASASWWSSGLAVGSGVDVVVDDEDGVFPPSAAAIAASSAASFGSVGVVVSVGSVAVAGSAAPASDAVLPDAFAEEFADDELDEVLPVVRLFVPVAVLPLVAAGGAAVAAVDAAGGGVEGAGACEDCDAGGGAGGAGGGSGGAAASISAENGVSGALPCADDGGGEKVECMFDGGGGAGDATADTKLTSIGTGAQN